MLSFKISPIIFSVFIVYYLGVFQIINPFNLLCILWHIQMRLASGVKYLTTGPEPESWERSPSVERTLEFRPYTNGMHIFKTEYILNQKSIYTAGDSNIGFMSTSFWIFPRPSLALESRASYRNRSKFGKNVTHISLSPWSDEYNIMFTKYRQTALRSVFAGHAVLMADVAGRFCVHGYRHTCADLGRVFSAQNQYGHDLKYGGRFFSFGLLISRSKLQLLFSGWSYRCQTCILYEYINAFQTNLFF